MKWSTLFVFNPIPDNRYDEFVSVVEQGDIIWAFDNCQWLGDGLRKIRDKLKSKILVFFQEMVMLDLAEERSRKLEMFLEEFARSFDYVFIHMPRHRIVWHEVFTKFDVIRTGLVVPIAVNAIFDFNREMRFIHYQQIDKYWKGSDIVDRLKHLPHIIVGYGEGAISVSYSKVLQLQASSELVVHPTRVDSYSRFLMSGLLLGCVPVLLMTNAELPFVLSNAKDIDKNTAYKTLRNYFSVHWDVDSFVEAVSTLMQEKALIEEYRDRLRMYLIHNADLWSPEIIYHKFSDKGLLLPSDLIPVTHLAHFQEEERQRVLPQGSWSNNPPSLVFYV